VIYKSKETYSGQKDTEK